MKKICLCEKCGKVFDKKSDKENEIDCLNHERKEHIPDEAIKCPTCKGEGWYYGNDMCDCRNCYDCDGIGYVIPEKVIRYNKL